MFQLYDGGLECGPDKPEIDIVIYTMTHIQPSHRILGQAQVAWDLLLSRSIQGSSMINSSVLQ